MASYQQSGRGYQTYSSASYSSAGSPVQYASSGYNAASGYTAGNSYNAASSGNYAAGSGNYAAGSGSYAAGSGSYGNGASNSGRYARQNYASSGYAGASSSAAPVAYQSQVEQAVINAREPLQVNERQEFTAGRYRGIYLNKSEVDSFRGPISIDQYRINDDPNPEVIRKRLDKVRYQQEISVRYLNPPPAPKPGDLIIREKVSQVPAAPPVVLRQEGQRAQTPPPLILRERPPQPPQAPGEQVVEVQGEPIPPPARRVVLEKLGNLPAKPQNIIVEKWLPYKPQPRTVRYEKAQVVAPPNPRNLVIEWESPEVEVEKVCRDLGVVDADPLEYVRRYGPELKDRSQLNLCENEVGNRALQNPQEYQAPELVGDVQALRLVDLERYGLSEYRRYV